MSSNWRASRPACSPSTDGSVWIMRTTPSASSCSTNSSATSSSPALRPSAAKRGSISASITRRSSAWPTSPSRTASSSPSSRSVGMIANARCSASMRSGSFASPSCAFTSSRAAAWVCSISSARSATAASGSHCFSAASLSPSARHVWCARSASPLSRHAAASRYSTACVAPACLRREPHSSRTQAVSREAWASIASCSRRSRDAGDRSVTSSPRRIGGRDSRTDMAGDLA